MGKPKFHGLFLVRDEADIVSQTLDHLLDWIDTLWVLDTGSTDGTDSILQKYTSRHSAIRYFGRHEIRFDQSLRAVLFNLARKTFRSGDWIAKIDADEFYHIPPPEFVEGYVKPHEGLIELAWYYFRLTTGEVESFESGRTNVLTERVAPISQRRRFYKVTQHREPRLFRYREHMQFHLNSSAPRFAGIRCSYPIPVRHYPHRDPIQMEARYKLRAAMIAQGSRESGHWSSNAWRSDVLDAQTTGPETGSLSTQPGHTDGDLLYWGEGTELPTLRAEVNQESKSSRLIRRLFYSGPVHIADRLTAGRSAFDESNVELLQKLSGIDVDARAGAAKGKR